MKDHALQFPNRKLKQGQALRDISERFPSSACLVLYIAIRHFVFRYARTHTHTHIYIYMHVSATSVAYGFTYSQHVIRTNINGNVEQPFMVRGHLKNSKPCAGRKLMFISVSYLLRENLLHIKRLKLLLIHQCRSQWPRGLRRRSSAARLLRLWVQIPPGAWMFVCCECCVLSGRGLCDGLITRPEESYRLCSVVVCYQETSKKRGS